MTTQSFKQALLEKAQELRQRPISKDQIAIERTAEIFDQIQRANDREIAMDSLNRNWTVSKQVALALDRIADGSYGDVVLDVFDWLKARRDAALAAGIARENIVLDPGVGFGKSVAENLALLNALPLFHSLGQPLLVGASRKRMIGALSHEAPAHKRLGGSLAIAVKAIDAGVQLIRVHDVAESVQAVRVWRGLRDAALTDFSQLAAA